MMLMDKYIVIEKTDFFENMDTIKEKRELTGGGGVHIEFTECSPGFSLCSPEDGLHIINSRYLMTECKFKSNEGFTSNDMDSHVIKNELVAGRYENVGYYGAGIGIYFKRIITTLTPLITIALLLMMLYLTKTLLDGEVL